MSGEAPARPTCAGPRGCLSVELPAEPRLLAIVCAAVREFAAVQGMSDADLHRLEVSVDEVISNVVCHAYSRDCNKRFRVTAERSESDELIVRVYDNGEGFCLEAVPAPDPNIPISEMQIGGLGLFLVQKMMDRIHYERTAEGENCMTLVKRIG